MSRSFMAVGKINLVNMFFDTLGAACQRKKHIQTLARSHQRPFSQRPLTFVILALVDLEAVIADNVTARVNRMPVPRTKR